MSIERAVVVCILVILTCFVLFFLLRLAGAI